MAIKVIVENPSFDQLLTDFNGEGDRKQYYRCKCAHDKPLAEKWMLSYYPTVINSFKFWCERV